MNNTILRWFIILSLLWIDFVTLGEIFNLPREINPELAAYVRDFVADAEKRHVSVNPIEIGRLEYAMVLSEDTNIGETYRPERFGHLLHLPTGCRIYIKMGLVPEIYKKATVYHELGHCLLGLDHDPDPTQIMYWQIPASEELAKDWDKKVDHLFATPRQ